MSYSGEMKISVWGSGQDEAQYTADVLERALAAAGSAFREVVAAAGDTCQPSINRSTVTNLLTGITRIEAVSLHVGGHIPYPPPQPAVQEQPATQATEAQVAAPEAPGAGEPAAAPADGSAQATAPEAAPADAQPADGGAPAGDPAHVAAGPDPNCMCADCQRQRQELAAAQAATAPGSEAVTGQDPTGSSTPDGSAPPTSTDTTSGSAAGAPAETAADGSQGGDAQAAAPADEAAAAAPDPSTAPSDGSDTGSAGSEGAAPAAEGATPTAAPVGDTTTQG